MKKVLCLLPILSFSAVGAEYSIGLSDMGGEINTMAVTFGARISFGSGLGLDTVANLTNQSDKSRSGLIEKNTDYTHLNFLLMPSYRFEPFEKIDFIVRAGGAININNYDYRESIYNTSGNIVDVQNKQNKTETTFGFAYGAALQYHLVKEEDFNVSLGISYDVTDFGEVDGIDFGSGTLFGGYVSVGF
ncbi:hypothetical protein ATY37_06145 [Vibrio cidicii]|uniref:Outer membrane protein beta-barrel domain-containing protein n=1 Tax=Vibrio cidicii TaxID=1763883 RepID=A0A151KU63_9VIBR|nr:MULTISPECIES: hypothetical protein [Vibrio]KYN82301.1 hypothetical protein ATY37_06145 [Vibrio cidicii]